MRSDSQERRMAMIAHDQPYWAACARVAGMDEAGRGPLAGDVVAACVIMPSAPTVDWVDDSKSFPPCAAIKYMKKSCARRCMWA